MEIGTIGAGAFAQAFAKQALKAGHKVKLSNSRGPDSLRETVNQLGPGAIAVAFDFKWRRVSELFGVCFGIIWRTTRQFVPITRLSRAASTTSTETW